MKHSATGHKVVHICSEYFNIITNLFFTLKALKDISHIFIFQQEKFLFSILIVFRPEMYGTVKTKTHGRPNLTILELRGDEGYIVHT